MVKRIPYEAEIAPELFSCLLLGAIGEMPDEGESQGVRRPFVAEWIIPGEALCCPAYTEQGLCRVYSVRPMACRVFPGTQDGRLHPACPFGNEVACEPYRPSAFSSDLARFDAHLLNILYGDGEAALGDLLGEKRPLAAPLLYNGYLLAVLILAGADLTSFFHGQRQVLRRYRTGGLDELTFLIPDTDWEISGPIAGLEANLEWLALRVRDEGLAQSCRERLRALGLPVATVAHPTASSPWNGMLC